MHVTAVSKSFAGDVSSKNEHSALETSKSMVTFFGKTLNRHTTGEALLVAGKKKSLSFELRPRFKKPSAKLYGRPRYAQ